MKVLVVCEGRPYSAGDNVKAVLKNKHTKKTKSSTHDLNTEIMAVKTNQLTINTSELTKWCRKLSEYDSLEDIMKQHNHIALDSIAFL